MQRSRQALLLIREQNDACGGLRFVIWGRTQIRQRYAGSRGVLSVCVRASASQASSFPSDPGECVCWVILPLPPSWFPACWVFLQSRSSEMHGRVCVHKRLTGGRTMQGEARCFLPSLFSCSPSMPFAPPIHSLFTTPSLPSPLRRGLSSLGRRSANTTHSAPSHSKKPLSTLGTTKMSLTPEEKTFTLSASCPQAWQGVHIEVGLTPAEMRHKKHTYCILRILLTTKTLAVFFSACESYIQQQLTGIFYCKKNPRLKHLTKWQSRYSNFLLINESFVIFSIWWLERLKNHASQRKPQSFIHSFKMHLM